MAVTLSPSRRGCPDSWKPGAWHRTFLVLEAPLGKDPDQRDYIVSNAKIEATGFMPRFSLDMGIEELIKGYTMIKNTLYGNV